MSGQASMDGEYADVEMRAGSGIVEFLLHLGDAFKESTLYRVFFFTVQ